MAVFRSQESIESKRNPLDLALRIRIFEIIDFHFHDCVYSSPKKNAEPDGESFYQLKKLSQKKGNDFLHGVRVQGSLALDYTALR